MVRQSILTIGLLLTVLGVVPVASAADVALDIDVRLAPTEEHGGGFRCTAVVRDARSGEVLSAPTITFLRGLEAETLSEVPGHGVLRFKVAVSEDGGEASYRAELVVEDKVIAAQSATIRL